MQNNMLEPGDKVTLYYGKDFKKCPAPAGVIEIESTINFKAQGVGFSKNDPYNQWEFGQKLIEDPNFPGFKMVKLISKPEHIFFPLLAAFDTPERVAEIERPVPNIKPLDIVQIAVSCTVSGYIDRDVNYMEFTEYERSRLAVVIEVKGFDVSLQWIGREVLPDSNNLFNTWWPMKELRVVDNLARILTKNMVHPFGEAAKDSEYGNKWYPIK